MTFYFRLALIFLATATFIAGGIPGDSAPHYTKVMTLITASLFLVGAAAAWDSFTARRTGGAILPALSFTVGSAMLLAVSDAMPMYRVTVWIAAIALVLSVLQEIWNWPQSERRQQAELAAATKKVLDAREAKE